MSVNQNDTDVSAAVDELVTVFSDQSGGESTQHTPDNQGAPVTGDCQQDLPQQRASSSIPAATDVIVSDVNEEDETEVIVSDVSNKENDSDEALQQNTSSATPETTEHSGNEGTVPIESMANMFTDAAGTESATVESAAAEDKTNTAFEDFLFQSANAKTEATEAYKQADLEKARLKYMTALELLQNVQGDLSNKQKSMLFEQTVACNNNVALCCIGLDDHNNTVAFATNSLLLIRSLERNIPDGMIWKCLTENGVTLDQLKKVWKKKALYYVGKGELKRKNFKEAAVHLEEALGLIVDDAKLTANANELRTLIADAKARHAKEKKREKSTWSKAFKKGKTEVESMYRDVEDSAPPSAATSPIASPAGQHSHFDPNNLKIDLSDLDINKKKKGASNAVAIKSDFTFNPFFVGLGVVGLFGIGTFLWMRYKRL